MPFLFSKPHARGATWQALPIRAPHGHVALDRLAFHPAASATAAQRSLPLLVRVDRAGAATRWALVVPSAATVLLNGRRVDAGVCALSHRDSLALPGTAPVFFSTEERAAIQPFAGPAAVQCPRCRNPVQPGEGAVRCPACGVVHHEAADRNCWTYAPQCAACTHPTALDAGLAWTPDLL